MSGELTRKPKRYSVDQRSRDLAEHFLGDDRPEEVYRDLAQQIQDCVEDFCSALENAELAAHEETLRDESPSAQVAAGVTGAMTNPSAEPKCYIARCVCGGIVFACVDDPKHTDDTAKAVAECLSDGFPIERVELDVARNGTWCTTSKECRNPPEPKPQAELAL